MDAVRFNINGDIPGLTNIPKSAVKGGVLKGGVFITTDAPWIKHLRSVDESVADEIHPSPEEPPVEPPEE